MAKLEPSNLDDMFFIHIRAIMYATERKKKTVWNVMVTETRKNGTMT